ncbi:MAG: cytochrome-c peroxidase [Vicinamibacterales bacterium]
MTTNKLLVLFSLLQVVTTVSAAASRGNQWTEEDMTQLSSMSLRELGPAPADPTNRVADDPRAVEFGRKLFFDTRLSANGHVSCATCHIPEREFQDGIPLAKGVGVTNRRTMPIAGMAHSPFLFWDGRKDSLWAQALGPLESPVEHGGSREQYAQAIAAHYRPDYEVIFGAMPAISTRDEATAVFVNIGKAIAAYERTIDHAPSRFDRYVDALQDTGRAPQGVLSSDEVAGLRLFIGKASCVNCHNGPLLTNNEFHNTAVPTRPGLPPDRGRLAGADAVLGDEFNCRSRWSDSRSNCAELEFLVTGDHVLERAFKVPSLRNVAERAPYMHAGQFNTLTEVLEHYNRAPKAPAGHSELEPLHLSAQERRQIEAFLRSLSGGARE